jgi:hypothetical protein
MGEVYGQEATQLMLSATHNGEVPDKDKLPVLLVDYGSKG